MRKQEKIMEIMMISRAVVKME